MTPESNLPAIGTQVHVRRQVGNTFQPAIVVGHLTDPGLGKVIELRLPNLQRVQRVWPSSEVRLDRPV
jgi:hypothetical protein